MSTLHQNHETHPNPRPDPLENRHPHPGRLFPLPRPPPFSAHHRPRARSRSHPGSCRCPSSSWFPSSQVMAGAAELLAYGTAAKIEYLRRTSPPGPRNRAMTAKQIARSLLLANTGFRHRPLRCDVVGSLQTGGSTPMSQRSQETTPVAPSAPSGRICSQSLVWNVHPAAPAPVPQ